MDQQTGNILRAGLGAAIGGPAGMMGGIPSFTSTATSAANPIFGSLLSNFDTSNWSVNFGDGGTAGVTAGPKAAPTLVSSPTQATQGATVIPANTPGLSLDGGFASISAGGAALPWLYLLGGAAVLVVLWKRL